MKKVIVSLVVLFGALHNANASAAGNAEAGKAKSATCAACHGADGNSMIDMYPKIAGQGAGYLVKQLHEFRLGSKTTGAEGRYDPVMSAQAAALSDEDIADLAAFYAGQKPKQGTTPEDVVEAGGKLYRGGDTARGITACIACHGPKGNGMSLANFPKISAQHSTYVKAQLEKFRDGSRSNDLNGMMRDVAAKLTDSDIETISKYLGGLK